jgi:hypothetical protein
MIGARVPAPLKRMTPACSGSGLNVRRPTKSFLRSCRVAWTCFAASPRQSASSAVMRSPRSARTSPNFGSRRHRVGQLPDPHVGGLPGIRRVGAGDFPLAGLVGVPVADLELHREDAGPVWTTAWPIASHGFNCRCLYGPLRYRMTASGFRSMPAEYLPPSPRTPLRPERLQQGPNVRALVESLQHHPRALRRYIGWGSGDRRNFTL